MSATDIAVTLACFLKWEAPDGDVRLCDGGFLDFASERYDAEDAVFGAMFETETLESSFGDAANDGQVVLAPNPAADVADWWRDDLFDTRLRIWMGAVEADGVTVSSAKLLADMLVDTVERRQGPDGEDLLAVSLIARHEKLFLVNEGNVCSERFHQSVWSGENGFNNCTDVTGFVAWGTATPQRSGTTSGGSGGSGAPGGSGGRAFLVEY